jgi:hypothetical protein
MEPQLLRQVRYRRYAAVRVTMAAKQPIPPL